MLMFDLCAMWCKADQILKDSGEKESAPRKRAGRERQMFTEFTELHTGHYWAAGQNGSPL